MAKCDCNAVDCNQQWDYCYQPCCKVDQTSNKTNNGNNPNPSIGTGLMIGLGVLMLFLIAAVMIWYKQTKHGRYKRKLF